MNNQSELNDILAKLNSLMTKQEAFTEEVSEIQRQINVLKQRYETQADDNTSVEPFSSPKHKEQIEKHTYKNVIPQSTETESKQLTKFRKQGSPKIKRPRRTFEFKLDVEKFIGENLTNKIGIIILVVGVGIGAKYAIDHDLISPLTRIILGYLSGLVLLGFGMHLRTKFMAYSAVLVSGAMAILYFITYIAFSFYQLFPETVAFGLMLIFTVFTVVAALKYDEKVIALIGLVGAYAVPFLLGNEKSNVFTLLIYVAIINIGILFIAVKKYWKVLYYSAFILTWVIFLNWYLVAFSRDHLALGLFFAVLFFSIFYVTFLAYKLHKKEVFNRMDILLLLTNSFIFYGIGFVLLERNQNTSNYLGLFTLGNAITHFGVSCLIFKRKLADRKLFYFIAGLVLVFVSIAIPVQLDGQWVTMLWAGQAALLFWIGRTKQVRVYENISYALMVLSFFSILEDWHSFNYIYQGTNSISKRTPLINKTFLAAMFFTLCLGIINFIHHKNPSQTISNSKFRWQKVMRIVMPALLIFVVFYAFHMEISTYFDQAYFRSAITVSDDETITHYKKDIRNFGSLSLIYYSMLFFIILSIVNLRYLKNKILATVVVGLNLLVILIYLTQGFFEMSSLRSSYINQPLSEYFHYSKLNIGIRYIGTLLVVGLLWVCHKHLRSFFNHKFSLVSFDILLHAVILWMASDELIHWMTLAQSTQTDQLGLSILWGLYSLVLIILGIYANKKHLRIIAIALFTITLIKLFFYDLSSLNTIAKTIVMVSLGVLLLTISFLYNKYKHLITDGESE